MDWLVTLFNSIVLAVGWLFALICILFTLGLLVGVVTGVWGFLRHVLSKPTIALEFIPRALCNLAASAIAGVWTWLVISGLLKVTL